MIRSSRRPGWRWIAIAAIALLAASASAACGGNTGSPSPSHSTSGAGAGSADSATPSPPDGADGELRLGCGTYCQNAGPLGGEVGAGGDAVTVVSSGTVKVGADGYLPITVRCHLSVQCRGSLLAYPFDWRFPGRSDLLVDAGATATLGVSLPDQLVAEIRAPCPPNSMSNPDPCPSALTVIADVGASFGCNGAQLSSELPACGLDPVNGFKVLNVVGLTALAPG